MRKIGWSLFKRIFWSICKAYPRDLQDFFVVGPWKLLILSTTRVRSCSRLSSSSLRLDELFSRSANNSRRLSRSSLLRSSWISWGMKLSVNFLFEMSGVRRSLVVNTRTLLTVELFCDCTIMDIRFSKQSWRRFWNFGSWNISTIRRSRAIHSRMELHRFIKLMLLFFAPISRSSVVVVT